MFSDPQTVTVDSVAKVMPRISTGGTKSVYQLGDQTFSLTMSHVQSNGRVRSMARLDHKAVVPDPLTSVNDYENLGIYLVIDRPLAGFTSAEVNLIITGFKTWLDSTTVGKLYGLES